MKFGVWCFVLENADGEIRKAGVVSTSGKAAKAQITTGEEILSMKRVSWLTGYSEAQVFAALANGMPREDAGYLVDVMRQVGIFGSVDYQADDE